MIFHQFVYFSTKNYKSYMHINAPVGSLDAANSSGWMTTDLFVDCLNHFKKAHKMCTRKFYAAYFRQLCPSQLFSNCRKKNIWHCNVNAPSTRFTQTAATRQRRCSNLSNNISTTFWIVGCNQILES